MILKILVLCSFGIADLSLIFTVWLGMQIKKSKDAYMSAYARHRRAGWTTLILTLAAVSLTEFMVRVQGKGQRGGLFWFHLIAFAIPYILSLPTLLWLNGRRSTWHKALAYTSAALCGGMNITGFILWYQRF